MRSTLLRVMIIRTHVSIRNCMGQIIIRMKNERPEASIGADTTSGF
jgi:hypothetical protein